MAFNLKKVLKALLYSSSQPLSIKDIQAAFTRFHETAAMEHAAATEDAPESATGAAAQPAEAGAGSPAESAQPPAGVDDASATPAAVPPPVEPAEVLVDPPSDPDLYVDVPSLITATQIRETMDEIAAELRAADDGMLLVEGSSGYRIVTHPRFARWVRILRAEPPPVKLSQSSIETLAIVAYRQPVTRGEIETIRGVSAEAGINKLLERELVYVVGRADLPGRPIQYGTTDKFLEFVGAKSLDELPASDVLSSRQIDDWLKTAMNPSTISDVQMGLADEQLPLVSSSGAATATLTDHHVPTEAVVTASPKPAEEPPSSEPNLPASP